MSWLSTFVDNNRNFAGNALKNAAPLTALIPGVGPLVAAGLAAATGALGQGIRKGSNIGDILKQGAVSGGEGYGAGQLAGAFGTGADAISGLPAGADVSNVANASVSGLPGMSGVPLSSGGIVGGLKAAGSALLGGTGLPGTSSTGLLSGIPGLSSITGGGSGSLNPMTLAALANAAYLGQKSSNFADIAGKNADAAYQEKAPLRAQGIAGMQAAPVQLPQLSAIAQRGNPFASPGA